MLKQDQPKTPLREQEQSQQLRPLLLLTLTVTVTVTLGLNTALVSDVEKLAAAEFKTRVTSITKSQS
jgi:hypothetical protein